MLFRKKFTLFITLLVVALLPPLKRRRLPPLKLQRPRKKQPRLKRQPLPKRQPRLRKLPPPQLLKKVRLPSQ
jgi:hypothetical protein